MGFLFVGSSALFGPHGLGRREAGARVEPADQDGAAKQGRGLARQVRELGAVLSVVAIGGDEHEIRGVVDLVDMKAYEYEGDGRDNAREIPIPDELEAQAQEYREKLMDEVAEVSDSLMERYLEGEEISHEEIVTALEDGTDHGHIFPVTCGVATTRPASLISKYFAPQL